MSNVRHLLLAAAVSLGLPSAFAQSTTWTSNSSGSWTSNGSWSNGVPTNSVNATVRRNATVTINSSAQASNVFVGGNGGVGSNNGILTISSNGTLETFGNVGVDVGYQGSNGTLNVNGLLITRQIIETNTTAGTDGFVNFNGGTVRAKVDGLNLISGFETGEVNILTGGVTIDTNNLSISIGSPLSGNGALTANGSGTLTLSANNTYTGGTRITGNTTLRISSNSNLGGASGNLTLNNGVLHTTSTISMNRSTSLGTGGGTYLVDGGTTLTQNGVHSGANELRKSGNGTLVLNGNNTYSGGTAINGGILRISSNTNLGNATGSLAFNGGTLHTTANLTANRSTSLGVNGGTYQVDNGTVLTVAGAHTGNGSLTKTGNGTLIFTGNSNTYTGGTFIEAGNLQFGNGGTTGFITGDIFNEATLTWNRSNTGTYSGNMSGSGQMIKDGTGTWTLTGTNTYSGGTTINSGTLRLGSGGTTGSITGNVTNNASLVVQRSNEYELDGVISGSGNLTQNGTGTLTLSGNNTYSGGTAINGGILRISSNANLGNATGSLAFNGGTLHTTANLTANRSTSLGVSGGTYQVDNGTVLTVAGAHTGNGSLTKTGNGTLIFTGNSNTYTGGTFIEAGNLQFGNGGTTGFITGNIFNEATLTWNRSNTGTYSGNMSGSGQMIKDGTGTWTLTGTNTYSGGTTINSGTLRLGSGGTTGSITGNVTNNATLVVQRSNAYELDGVISGSGNLTQNGTGTLILTGNNTYSGLTTVNAGTLKIGNGGTTGAITGNVTNNASLVFERSNTYEFEGVVTGSGNLTQNGTGTLILTGNNSYSGLTTVNSGVLQLGNNGTSGWIEGDVVVSSLLRFSRTDDVVWNTEISGNGTVQKQGAGTLTFSGANSFTGGTILDQGTLATGNAAALAGGPLSLTGGTLAPSGSLDISDLIWTGGKIALTLGTQNDWVNITDSFDATSQAGEFLFVNGKGFVPNTLYRILTGPDLAQLLPLFFGNPLLGLNPVFSESNGDLFVNFIGKSTGSDIQNNGGPWTPTNADFVVDGQVRTGGPSDDNTIRSLIFRGGSFLRIFNNLFVTSGNLTVDPGVSTISGGNLVSQGDLNKSGAGTLVTEGQLTVGGTANIREGGLIVNGTFVALKGLNVFESGLLGGIGRLIGDLVNRGTIAPGNSPGTLVINGNFIQTDSGTFSLEIENTTVFDRLLVSGNAALAGRLDVSDLGGSLAYGQSYAFLQAGSITGSFDNITMPIPSRFRGRFLSDGSTGTLLVAPTSYTLVAQNSNQRNVATALDSFIPATSGDRLTVSVALDRLTAQQYPAAFDQIMPGLHEIVGSYTIEQAFVQTQLLNQRLSSVRLGAQGFQAIGLNNEPLVHDKDGKRVADPKDLKTVIQEAANPRWSAWAFGYGNFARVTTVNQIPNGRSDSGGFLAGTDYRWNENFATGIYAGYQGGYSEFGSAGNMRTNSVLFGAYSTLTIGGFYLDSVVGGGYTNAKVNRSIEFGTLDRNALSQQDSGQINTSINLGYDWKVAGFTFGPIGGLQYTFAGVAPFTERGAESLNLRVGQQYANSLRSTLGARVAYTWLVSPKLALIPEIRMLWQHEFLNDSRAINASLDGGSGPAFDYWTSTPGRDSVFAGAGISAAFGDTWNASLFYNADFGRQDYISHTISAGLGLKF